MEHLLITKTLTFKPDDPLLPFGKYVFQRVAPGKGNIPSRPALDLQLRRHVVPPDPRTPAQLARRDKMRQAVLIWHGLSDAEKLEWKARGTARRISGFNAFVSAVLNGAPLVLPTVWDGQPAKWDDYADRWDGGTASWDAGAASWGKVPEATWDAGAAEWDPAPAAQWDGGTAEWDKQP